MTQAGRDTLIREYAAVEITWQAQLRLGYDDYLDALGAPGELRLRPPLTSTVGPTRRCWRIQSVDDILDFSICSEQYLEARRQSQGDSEAQRNRF